MENEKGVWRTIRGRRVFIREGEDLASAMARSGKFKESEAPKHKAKKQSNNKVEKKTIYYNDIQKAKNEDDLQRILREHDSIRTNTREESKRFMKAWSTKAKEIRQQSNNYANDDYKKQEEIVHNAKEERDRLETYLNNLGDDYGEDNPDFDETKWALKDAEDNYRHEKAKLDKMYEKNNKVESEYELYKRAKENPESIDPMTENSTDWEALEKKYNKQDTIKKFKGKKQSNKLKKEDDWLPKETEIKEQGTSNRKEVSDNIQAHILSYYDSPQDFVEQMDVFDNLPTTWHRGEEMAKQGFYSIYYDDQRKFLESLKINPKNKNFSDDRVFQTYTSLIGRESAKLYDKIKKHQKDK